MGAEAYTWAAKYKKNLVGALMAARMILLCFVYLSSVAIMAQEPELCVDPEAPLPEIFNAAENAISRLEKRQTHDLSQFLRSGTRKAQAWQEIADLDQQLLNFILLRESHGVEVLELKWRQYSAGCREKRILLLLLSWNYLPEHWDSITYPENNVRYWDLSAWNPTSEEYQARREEIDFVRKHGRNAYDRIERLIAGCREAFRTQEVGSDSWRMCLVVAGLYNPPSFSAKERG